MTYRVISEDTRHRLRVASAKGHDMRWSKTLAVRAEKRRAVLAHYATSGNMRETARVLGCSSSWVWQVVSAARTAFPVDTETPQ